uniref:C2H2-type domain-containing protein n=1 Tax=Lygus hesperus TaxID=30085 RepID=A0A0K8TE40_LYGHE
MATIEDLGDVKILIIPEVSEFKDGEAPGPIVADLQDASSLHQDLQDKIVEFLKNSRNLPGEDIRDDECGKKRKAPTEKSGISKKTARDEDFIEVLEVVPPKGKHQCKLCYKAFNHKSTLSRHKTLAHTVNPPIFICAHCSKRYKTKVSLRRHLQNVESKDASRKTSLAVNCALCDYKSGKSEMLEHYEQIHGTTIEKEIIKFASEDEFHVWKHQTEIHTTARFTKIRKDRIIKDGTKESFYRCHRDGVYKPRGNNLRNLKKLGSNKINGHCPAKMQVWINQDDEVSVMFVKTHVGHEMDISRLTLTKQERDHIAQQLALQVPFDTILEACRESAVGAENIRRMNLLTRKDLYNIESSYSLSKVTYRNCLGINVEGWVKEMIGDHCDSFIKFYKPQGKILEDYPTIDVEDFILVLMNDAQVEILKGGGSDYVCVDATSIASDFSLLTVLVLDERDQGFPVAFLITNNCDNHVMELFFSTLKEATSIEFKPRIFITSLDDSVYKSWNSIMSAPSFRIYSPWIVDEDWRSNLDKITNPEKQVEYYNKLISVMEESNVQTFEEEMDCTYRAMKNDPETVEFAEFFEIYKSKASSWAHCFRGHLGPNVNEQLERIQASLKVVLRVNSKKFCN